MRVLLGLLLMLLNAPAWAEPAELDVGGSPILFSPPKGYCLADEQREPDKSFLISQRKLNEGQNLVVAAFIACDEQKKGWAKAAKDWELQRWGIVLAPLAAIGKPLPPRAQILTELSEALADGAMGRSAEEAKRKLANTASKLDVLGFEQPRADEHAVYLQGSGAYGPGKGDVVAMQGAMTRLHDRVVVAYAYARKPNAAAQAKLRADVAAMAKSLVAANDARWGEPTQMAEPELTLQMVEATAMAPQGGRFGDGQTGQLLLAGAGLAGLAALMFLVGWRRRPTKN